MNQILKKKDMPYYIFICLIYILVFQDFIQRYIGIVQYIDELLALTAIPVVCIKCFKEKSLKIKKYDLILISSLAILGILGIFSNIKYKYQMFNVVMIDGLLIFKFFLVYYLSEITLKNKEFNGIIKKNVRFIIVVLFILMIFNYIFNIWKSDIRFGIKSNTLFYSHPTMLVATCVFLLAMHIREEKKYITKYTCMLLALIFSSLRFKAIGFEILFLIMGWYLKKFNKKISPIKIGITALILIAISFHQINYYFIEIDNSARSMLLKTSFKVANDHFPIGTGFGTYGSFYSGIYYSPVYSLYKLDSIQGLQKGSADFISDSFWPMIIGQFGYIGTIAYFTAIIMIYIKIQKKYDKDNQYIYASKLLCLAYLFISSTSESAFVHPMAIPLAIILGM